MELSQSERIKILNECSIEIFLNHKKKITRDCILKYLSVKNYQGIQLLTLNNLPNDAQWIFLTGENGYGKTSVLRAIAKGLLGDEELVTQIGENTEIISVVDYHSTLYLHKISKGQKNHNNQHINILGYGTSRFGLTRDRNYGNAHTLFEDNGELLNIEKLLETADNVAFEKIKEIFKALIPKLSDIKKEYVDSFAKIFYQEKNENGDTFDYVELYDLAAGYRGIITMIGDMIRRFNPVLKTSFKEVTGIVIIDEFDAHLHPKYQYELPKLLSTVFPKIQFIVSTHSPIPLLGVEPNTAVVLTVNRTKELGITVDRLDDDIPFHHLLPNSLLTSPIFGFENLFPRDTPISEIASADHWKDVEESINLQKELEQLKADGLID